MYGEMYNCTKGVETCKGTTTVEETKQTNNYNKTRQYTLNKITNGMVYLSESWAGGREFPILINCDGLESRIN